tara:strand:- start:4511 stop:4750 length:240 start_codon:yes stop_codon:yes gene_type:complete
MKIEITKKHVTIATVIILVIIGTIFLSKNGFELPTTAEEEGGDVEITSSEEANSAIAGLTEEIDRLSERLREIDRGLGG